MLVPVPLAKRVRQATLVVEARVSGQQPEQLPGSGHIVTRHTLEVYKVFKGQLPAGPLSVLTPGGTLGLAREVVSGAPTLGEGQQGIFLLEADPASPADYRAYAGTQGFIAYDLATLTAAEPFGRYPAIKGGLYATLAGLAGQTYRTVQPNAGLAAAQARATQRTAQVLAATPAISSFAPGSVTAGTSTSTSTSDAGVLTISGSGFNATQGSGYVEFRNADDGGNSYVRPVASDYLSWSDTQIRVRVPSKSTTGNAAGSGTLRVTNSDGNQASSSASLTVTYAISNVSSNSLTYRALLTGTDGAGGYTLHYSPSFPAAAQAPFETALATWRCNTGANRTIGAATSTDATARDNLNVVRFAGASELTNGVLGVTYSYYNGCSVNGGATNWQLVETDYAYAPTPYTNYTWNFSSSSPTDSQFDFQSVALHELGHGIQLTHIISSTGVMNYALPNGQTRRALDSASDVAGAKDVFGYSTSSTADQRCGAAVYATSTANCTLPVELVAFAARYAAGEGTTLGWVTASEQQSAYFAIESQENEAPWQEIARQPAAGYSAHTRQYQARDPRPLAGTRYYRLRQVDQDGTTTYSPTAAVQNEAAALAAYPNPAAGLVHLSGPLRPGATAQVRVLDALGRCARRVGGPAGQASFDLPLAGLPAGLYVLEWDGGTGPSRLRLTVE